MVLLYHLWRSGDSIFLGKTNWLGDGASRSPPDRESAKKRLQVLESRPKDVRNLFQKDQFYDEVDAAHVWELSQDTAQGVCRVLLVPTYENTDPDDCKVK